MTNRITIVSILIGLFVFLLMVTMGSLAVGIKNPLSMRKMDMELFSQPITNYILCKVNISDLQMMHSSFYISYTQAD